MSIRTGEPLEKGENKKARLTGLEESRNIDRQLKDLYERREELRRESCGKMTFAFDKIKYADFTTTYLYLKNHQQEDWTCLICTTNFLPMVLAAPGAVAADYLHHCEQCGAPICFKCMIQLMTINRHNNESIGAQCPGCKFYNCNRIEVGKTSHSVISEMAFPSGYSTVDASKVKGEKLITSNAVTSNEYHVKNLADRQTLFDVMSLHIIMPSPQYDGHDNNYDLPTSPMYSM